MTSAPPSPLGAVARGLVAAAAGTAAMDLAQYVQYRRSGGARSAWVWETSADLDTWEAAPAPAQVGRRLVEGLFQHTLPARRARLVSNVMHWAYGTGWGALLGIVQPSLRVPRAVLGPAFGTTVWLSGYATLAPMGLYKPIWKYPPKVLAKDLSNHQVYGAVSVAVLGALTRDAPRG